MQNDYTILKKTCNIIQECLSTQYSNSVLRLSDIYEYICKDDQLHKKFLTPLSFNKFMRKMHDENILKQFIKNYSAEPQTNSNYKWSFYPKAITSEKTPIQSEIITDSNSTRFMPWGLRYKANNGIIVRSRDELFIMNELLNEPSLIVSYEKIFLEKENKKCFPDFTIENLKTRRVFIWEHFGLIEYSPYCEEMVDKIAFYNELGYLDSSEKNKYTFIATIKKNPLQFSNLVKEYIEEMKTQKYKQHKKRKKTKSAQ